MKKIAYIIIIAAMVVAVRPVGAEEAGSLSSGDVCKARCRVDEGLICLERGPCEPINEFLLEAAEECRKNPVAKYMPITNLLFVDIMSRILRLDKELPNIEKLTDEERYLLETRLLNDKGIDMFLDTDPLSPFTRDVLADILKDVTVEQNLGFSNGLADQFFDLKNEEFIVYEVMVYVDEGQGFQPWEIRKNFKESLADSRHLVAKLDSCDDANVLFGDGIKGKIPGAGARIKVVYKFYGREDEIVTECEIAMLLSNPELARSIKNTYNPSPPLTKENFADLLIKTRRLTGQLPKGFQTLSDNEIYKIKAETLEKNGIDIFVTSDPKDYLTREELARILYDCPVEEVVGISDGTENQGFELSNAGFVIYDLHAYVEEEKQYDEWNKQDSFFESSSGGKDYMVKLDSGNYVTIYFGDGKKGRIPTANSPVKVKYRLYAPVTMLTEDDIICALGRCVPVVEAYEPPAPPFEFPDPKDGFTDPASQL